MSRLADCIASEPSGCFIRRSELPSAVCSFCSTTARSPSAPRRTRAVASSVRTVALPQCGCCVGCPLRNALLPLASSPPPTTLRLVLLRAPPPRCSEPHDDHYPPVPNHAGARPTGQSLSIVALEAPMPLLDTGQASERACPTTVPRLQTGASTPPCDPSTQSLSRCNPQTATVSVAARACSTSALAPASARSLRSRAPPPRKRYSVSPRALGPSSTARRDPAS